MEYCLIEEWRSEYTLPKRSRAVAVTPKASCELEKSGIEYYIFEDFCPLSKTHKENVDEYMVGQLSWFEKFDQFVQEIYPDAKQLDLKLALLYYYNIKYLADHLVTNIDVLNSFIDRAKPSKIWYIAEINGEDRCDEWHWFHYGRSSYFRLIERLCKKKGVNYEELIILKRDKHSIKRKQSLRLIFSDFTELKILIKWNFPWLLPLVINIKKRYARCKNISIEQQSKSSNQKGNILIIKNTDYSNQFLRDASTGRYALHLFENDKIYTPSLFSKGKKIPFDKKGDIEILNGLNLDEVMLKLSQGPIIEWINERCGMDVFDILRLRFEYLVKDLFPKTIGLVKGFVEYYNSNNIDYVFTNSLSTNYDFAAMAAARISQKTKSVGFFHGIDAEKAEQRYFMENYHFDLYFTSTNAEADHIKKLRNEFGYSHPIVNTFPYFRDQFNLVGNKKERVSSICKQRKKQVVLFLPIIRKYRNSAAYTKKHITTMESIRWHNVLIDYFSSRTDCDFIWKDIAPNENFDDSIYRKFKDNQYNNIRYENKALKKCLPEVDKVICDIASTGFFECIFSGLPVVTFNDKENDVMREDAFTMLGDSLQSYSTLDEKLKIVEKYLDDDPKKYLVSLPREETSVKNVLDDYLV